MKHVKTPAVSYLAICVACAVSLALHAQQPVGVVPLTRPAPPIVVDGLEVIPVQGSVYMLAGAGGNISAQIGDEGVLLVDSGGAGHSNKILAAVGRLTTRPVRFLVNTNADPDHVSGNGAIVSAHGSTRGPRPGGVAGGNPQGQNAGVMTVAHENAYNRMVAGSPKLAALTGDALPESTFFTARKEFFANGEPIQLLAQPNAHTDGDVMVFFRKSDVLSTGDVFVTTSYPVIDASSGGSVQGVLDALNTILEITVPERNQMGGTRVVPGHGRICNEADVVEYRDMVTIIRDRVRDLSRKGMTLQQVRAARPALEYDGVYGASSGEWTTDMFLEAIFKEVSSKR